MTLPGILPRISLLLGLTLALTVLGLAALIRAMRSVMFSAFTAGCAVMLLIANRMNRPVTMHVVITSFGFSLAISILLGCWLLTRTAARHGVAVSDSVRWLSFSLLGGFLGARLGYVLINSNGLTIWRDSLDYELGGLLGYGADFGGIFGAAVAMKGDFRQFRNWLDWATPLLLLCTGLTKLGCYFQGCDFGRPLCPKAPVIISVLGTFPRWKPAANGTFSRSAGVASPRNKPRAIIGCNRFIAGSPDAALRGSFCTGRWAFVLYLLETQALWRKNIPVDGNGVGDWAILPGILARRS